MGQPQAHYTNTLQRSEDWRGSMDELLEEGNFDEWEKQYQAKITSGEFDGYAFWNGEMPDKKKAIEDAEFLRMEDAANRERDKIALVAQDSPALAASMTRSMYEKGGALSDLGVWDNPQMLQDIEDMAKGRNPVEMAYLNNLQGVFQEMKKNGASQDELLLLAEQISEGDPAGPIGRLFQSYIDNPEYLTVNNELRQAVNQDNNIIFDNVLDNGGVISDSNIDDLVKNMLKLESEASIAENKRDYLRRNATEEELAEAGISGHVGVSSASDADIVRLNAIQSFTFC